MSKTFKFECTVLTDNRMQTSLDSLKEQIVNAIHSFPVVNHVLAVDFKDVTVNQPSEPNYVAQMSQPDVTREQTIIGLADKKKRLLIEHKVNQQNIHIARQSVITFEDKSGQTIQELQIVDLQLLKAIKS